MLNFNLEFLRTSEICDMGHSPVIARSSRKYSFWQREYSVQSAEILLLLVKMIHLCKPSKYLIFLSGPNIPLSNAYLIASTPELNPLYTMLSKRQRRKQNSQTDAHVTCPFPPLCSGDGIKKTVAQPSQVRTVCMNCHSQQGSVLFISRPGQRQPEDMANCHHHSKRFPPLEHGRRRN